MSKPLIGISTYLEPSACWGVWKLAAALLPAGYQRLVQRAGGLAAMLSPAEDPPAAARIVARLDGLVIAGGPDVEPVRYGAELDPAHRASRAGPGRVGAGADRRRPGVGRSPCSASAAACSC
ncbi:hypothetical protein SANTM175S_06322 [Streptomyces antimycoticus]